MCSTMPMRWGGQRIEADGIGEAAGLPGVAASATGSQSLVSDGVTGRLIRAGAVHDFADALQHYVEDAGARRAAGDAGERASERYGWDQVNQALVDTYLRVVRQRASGGGPPGRSPVP